MIYETMPENNINEKENLTYLNVNLNLPDYSPELSKAEEVINNLKKQVAECTTNNSINDIVHTTLFEEIVRVLAYVGKLSIPAFEIENELEDMYLTQYKHAPELAKKMWMDHYEKIHHPYSLLKNRCFHLLDEIDELYEKKFKKHPPNWNL